MFSNFLLCLLSNSVNINFTLRTKLLTTLLIILQCALIATWFSLHINDESAAESNLDVDKFGSSELTFVFTTNRELFSDKLSVSLDDMTISVSEKNCAKLPFCKIILN